MVHSDDKGLVLPPKIARISVVVVPIFKEENKDEVLGAARALVKNISHPNINTIKLDDRDRRPGDKFYEWERKGVPIRIEIGPKDISNNSVVIVRRDTGEKKNVSQDGLSEIISETLADIQKNLYDRAMKFRDEKTKTADSWDEFVKLIDGGNFVLAHFDGTRETEAEIKKETNATIRCIPLDTKEESGKCVKSGNASKGRVIFARSY